MKNCLFAMALLSLALAGGCAKGGNGIIPPPESVSVSAPTGVSATAIYPTQSITLTATVTGTTSTTLTWTMTTSSGAVCTATTCGTLTPASDTLTAAYVAPASTTAVTVTATLASDTSISGTLGINVIAVSVVVTPSTVNVGQNLAQQFTAVATPNYAPQTFTWTCTPTGSCGSLSCGTSNPTCSTATSAPAVFTAPASNGNVVVTATSAVQQSTAGTGQAKVSVASSRLPLGAYAFQFSGYDTSSPPNPVALAGSVTVGANGAITSGVEDVVIDGAYSQYTGVTGSYVPINDNNNLGTLTLDASAGGGPAYTFTAVPDSSGILQMIESDGAGTGSGILQKSAANSAFNSGIQDFAFGFTGVDSTGNRVGYVGLLTLDGSGNIGNTSPALIDANDNRTTTKFCATPPCTVTGTYALNPNGVWQMTLIAGGTTLDFDFFVSAGTPQTKTSSNPLTLYAISTDPIATNPAVSGSMVYQVPTTYNNAAFNGTSVSALTGVNGANTNVSLTLGTTDGTSSGTGGTGGFTGNFDENSAGTILSVSAFPSATQSSNPYTYVATNGNTGRYIFQMLGNPTASTAVPPIPFILYASGANRGFLLDQSSSSVITGTMTPQGNGNGILSVSDLVGTYGAATTASGGSSVDPIAANLLFTFANNETTCTSQCIDGTLYESSNPAPVTLVGASTGYTLMDTGTGTIAMTTPAQNYVIYAVDTAGTCKLSNPLCAIDDFFMIDVTSTNPNKNPSIIFAKQ